MSASGLVPVAEPDLLMAEVLRHCRSCIAVGRRPLLALNGPVGAGKTTLSRSLRVAFAAEGLQLAVASIDDAYLPWPQRRHRMAGNPFGVTRVPPGSHDPQALLTPLRHWRRQQWRSPATALAALQLPRFDKTLCDGAGDRVADWHGEADAVLLEGWMVGCRPLPARVLQTWPGRELLDPSRRQWLMRCNEALTAYTELWDAIDALVMLWPLRWSYPRRWRLQAEARQRRAGGGWLTAAKLECMIQASLHSLPPELYHRPLLADACWVRELDGQRRCRWQGSGAAMLARLDQASSPCSSATG